MQRQHVQGLSSALSLSDGLLDVMSYFVKPVIASPITLSMRAY